MFAYFNLLTLALAAGVGATNSSSPHCPDEVITSSFPLALRPTTALSVPFSFPQVVDSNHSFSKSPVLPEHIAKEPLSNVSDPISDSVKLEMVMMEVIGWTLVKLLLIGFSFSLVAETGESIEMILVDAVPDLEQIDEDQSEMEQNEEEQHNQEKNKGLMKTSVGVQCFMKVDGMDFDKEGEDQDEPYCHPVAEDYDADKSDDEESHC